MKQKIIFSMEQFDSSSELNADDLALLNAAKKATELSYAPYSNFLVGAAAKLTSGKTVVGSNQENASFGASVCAERVLLASLSVVSPKDKITTLAVSYKNLNGKDNKPISPCGICRQSLLEYEMHTGQTIRIIMSGQEGMVWILDSARSLLPLAFSNEDML